MQWRREITLAQWCTLFAAQLGWMLDAMDVMLFSCALTGVRTEFRLSSAAAGAFGGIFFGWLSDRYGRARSLVWSILAFSAVTAFTATARSVPQLVFWRALSGIGLGGEWAAGSVLVAETWPQRHRGKAIGLMQSAWAVGYLLAALLAAVILPRWGWRTLFVAGLLPALVPSPVSVTAPIRAVTGVPSGSGASCKATKLRDRGTGIVTVRKCSMVRQSISFFARRDEFLSRDCGCSWGRLLTCGGLSIRLPPLDAPLRPSEERHHRLRLAAMRGSLSSCAPVARLPHIKGNFFTRSGHW